MSKYRWVANSDILNWTFSTMMIHKFEGDKDSKEYKDFLDKWSDRDFVHSIYTRMRDARVCHAILYPLQVEVFALIETNKFNRKVLLQLYPDCKIFTEYHNPKVREGMKNITVKLAINNFFGYKTDIICEDTQDQISCR